MSSITTVGPRTLADVIPGGLVRSIALIAGCRTAARCLEVDQLPPRLLTAGAP